MMQQLRNPKNVKMVSLFVAAIFVLGIFALSMTQSGVGQTSSMTNDSAIGVVNYQILVSQSPALQTYQETMQQEVANAEKEFKEKSENMSDAEKQSYHQQIQERLAAKQKELMDPIMQKIDEEIKKNADKKGLSVVVEKNTVVYGGTDITDEVAKALQSSK